jgi:quinol monooxygenase YgiN
VQKIFEIITCKQIFLPTFYTIRNCEFICAFPENNYSSLLKKEANMYARLTTINFLPGRAEEAKMIYNGELVPAIRKQKGNLDCRLLEPVNKDDDYISITAWETKEDADVYHSSGTYKKMVDRVRDLFSREPVLKVYSSESVMEPA